MYSIWTDILLYHLVWFRTACPINGFVNKSIVKYDHLGYMGIPYGILAIWIMNFKNLISEFPHIKACLCLFFKLSLVLKNKTILLRVSSFRPYKSKKKPSILWFTALKNCRILVKSRITRVVFSHTAFERLPRWRWPYK